MNCPICGLDNTYLEFYERLGSSDGNRIVCYNCEHGSVNTHEHNERLFRSKQNKEFDGLRILLFQPCCCGDNIIASLAPELFHIKYPGCTVDFFTSTQESMPILIRNPFINRVIINQNWELYRTRDTLEPGELLKDYDMGYSLYWWNPPQVVSFLEDLELPTDYQHVRIYTTSKEMHKAEDVWAPARTEFRIALQIEGAKWNKTKYYQELKEKLRKYGYVLELGRREGYSYLDDAEIIRQADLMVCSTGSIEHVSAAVSTQTVTLSPVYMPEANCAAYYQNKYMPVSQQHLIVRPSNWCGKYNCISLDPNSIPYKNPPYGFPEGRFPPHMFKDCDYGGFAKTCIHEITPDEIIKKVQEAIDLRSTK